MMVKMEQILDYRAFRQLSDYRAFAIFQHSSIATTQFSPELNSLDWGGSIIGKINHTPHHSLITFFDQYRQV